MTCEFKYRNYAGAAVFCGHHRHLFLEFIARAEDKQNSGGSGIAQGARQTPQTPVDIANETAR